MIQRVVVIKLKEAYANSDDRSAVAEHSRSVLQPIPGVLHLDVAT